MLTAAKDKPFGWPPKRAAILDRRSTRRRNRIAVGTEEWLRRGRTEQCVGQQASCPICLHKPAGIGTRILWTAKETQKVAQVLADGLRPLATKVKKAVKQAVAGAGDAVLEDKEVKSALKKVVKKAVKGAVDEAVDDLRKPS